MKTPKQIVAEMKKQASQFDRNAERSIELGPMNRSKAKLLRDFIHWIESGETPAQARPTRLNGMRH